MDSFPSNGDAEALLDQLRRRADKLLRDLNHDRSEWESAELDSAVKEKGRSAVIQVIQAAEHLAKVVHSDCLTTQSALDQDKEGHSR